MNSIEFKYWLQGFFEISGEVIVPKEQTSKIYQKLQTVEKDSFCYWLEGFLDSCGEFIPASNVAVLKAKLALNFLKLTPDREQLTIPLGPGVTTLPGQYPTYPLDLSKVVVTC